MDKKNNEITFFQKFIFSLGMFPMTILVMAIGSFVIYYYTEYVGVSMATVSLMLLITRIWDVINDPLFGIIADKTPELRFGKNKLYLLIGGILGAISYYLMFSLPTDANSAVKLVWLYTTYIGVSMALTIFQISNFGLYVKLTSTPEERAGLSALQTLIGAFGGLIPSILLIPMVRVLGKGNDLRGFSSLAGIVSMIVIVCIILIIFIVPENAQITKRKKEKHSIGESIKVVLKNKPALLVSIATFFTAMMAIVSTLLTPYFAKYVIRDEMFMSYAGLVSLLGIIVVVPFSGKLVGKFGAKTVFYGATVVQMVSRLILTTGLANVSVILVALFISGMGAILIPILLKSMLADAADYGLYKYKIDSKGIIASVKGGLDKGANAITPALVGLILSVIGYTSGTDIQTESVISWIKYLYIFGPVVANVMVVIPMLFYKLDKSILERISENIQELEL